MSKINCSEQVQVITFTNVKYYTTMKVPSIEGTPERKSNQDQNRQAGNRPGEPYHTSIIQSTTLAQSKPGAGIDLKPLKDKQTATVLSNLSHEHFDQQKWPPSLPTHKKKGQIYTPCEKDNSNTICDQICYTKYHRHCVQHVIWFVL